VINADASQVYADLAILSARPNAEEMDGVPHRLFGHIDASQAYNAARWAVDARAAIAEAHAAGRVPILVGGTGLYLRTLLFGIAPVPGIDPRVRTAVRALSVAEAHAALAIADPAAAERLHPADTSRVARALEVVRSTGRTLADWQRVREGGIADDISLAPLILLPRREWLRARCDARLVQMFDGGAIEEVEALLARGLDPDLPAMRAIGVPQIAALIRGEIGRADALEQAQAATRQYAKRQFTWFRHQPPADWPRHDESLNNDSMKQLAIILRDKLLTG
jgi:tRNA dimethylallyltransferase